MAPGSSGSHPFPFIQKLENDVNGLFYQTFEIPDLPLDDVETGMPEAHALDAEAGGEDDGIGEAGRGEAVVVVGAEGVGVFAIVWRSIAYSGSFQPASLDRTVGM
ncbi:MAG: hypothetical protein JWN14_432 [Chthonomonadales bacterium]|nr:hypothetical protein [Chthonomonadales bacterium]